MKGAGDIRSLHTRTLFFDICALLRDRFEMTSVEDFDIEKCAVSDCISPADTTDPPHSNDRNHARQPGKIGNQSNEQGHDRREHGLYTQALIESSSTQTTKPPAVSGRPTEQILGQPVEKTFGRAESAIISSDCFSLYRRFAYLQSRLLLEKQDVLRVLECKLDEYDRQNISNSVTRTLLPDELATRGELLEQIEKAFNSYATVLTSAQHLEASNRPSASEYNAVRMYLRNNKPLVDEEMDYLQYKEDLITLRPGRDHAWLDRRIERSIHILQRPFPFINRIFCSPETHLKYRSSHSQERYYTPSRIDFCASLLLTSLVGALLAIPIWLLFSTVSRENGRGRGRGGLCVGIVLVSTLLFCAVLAACTRARRHEVLGAAAAYCAVLVVFLGNVPH
ncbi:hypothetical protein WHR41_05920 [Cladosporium halotolerans]|uniref:DUF6594 domain-containing protein n=1 Tax=Cladosporium halotolerans TaxID=1052096 RepID=A0AB34KPV0_9PEZI